MSGLLNTVAILKWALIETIESCHRENQKCPHTNIQRHISWPHSEPLPRATLIPECPSIPA